jgi:glycosyltransferase involved in cell wall biosynthesis
MKIIFFQPALPSYRLDFFSRLSDSEHDIAVYYSPVSMGALTAKRANYDWEFHLGKFVNLLPGINWQCRAVTVPIRKGDIVIISGAPRSLSNLVLLLKARVVGARSVWWGHYWSATSKHWRFCLRLLLMRLSDSLLFYTDHEISEYRSQGQGLHDKRPIIALSNGIAIDPIVEHRKVYKSKERGNSILFIGRLTFKARLDIAIEALCQTGLENVTLHVIGSGESEESLKSQAAELELRDRIVWHGGMTDEYLISKIANRCRIFIYPGEVGLSLVHAMAYGLPAILHTDRWSHGPEFAAFENGKTGCGFHRNDIVSLASAIRVTILDEGKLDSWSRECVEIITKNYNTAIMAERMLNMISNLKLIEKT